MMIIKRMYIVFAEFSGFMFSQNRNAHIKSRRDSRRA